MPPLQVLCVPVALPCLLAGMGIWQQREACPVVGSRPWAGTCSASVLLFRLRAPLPCAHSILVGPQACSIPAFLGYLWETSGKPSPDVQGMLSSSAPVLVALGTILMPWCQGSPHRVPVSLGPFSCLHLLSLLPSPTVPCAQDPWHRGHVRAGEQTRVHRITKVNMLQPLASGLDTSACSRDGTIPTIPTPPPPAATSQHEPPAQLSGVCMALPAAQHFPVRACSSPSAARPVPLSVCATGRTDPSVRPGEGRQWWRALGWGSETGRYVSPWKISP